MLIANLNIFPSRIIWDNEIQSIYPITLLNEKLLLSASLSLEFIRYNDFELYKDERILKLLMIFYHKDASFLDFLKEMEESLLKVKKLNNQKRKDKFDLQLIGNHKTMINKLKSTLKECIINRLTSFKIIELAGFDKEGIWDVKGLSINSDDNKEDGYIPVLKKAIAEHEYILWFNSIVEDIFSFNELDSNENICLDFIKIPLWDFPLFDGITFLQMKYTIDDLKPILVDYNARLKEVTEKLFNIHFTTENKAEIRQVFTDYITPLIPVVQQGINDSLYLSQLQHKSEENTGTTFNLGITSAENLVNYYEKSEIILPYISSEIKVQLKRNIDLKESCLFLYVTPRTSDLV